MLEQHGLNIADLKVRTDDAIRADRCPSCERAMSPVIVKHSAVDLCFGCGTMFLDEPEGRRILGERLL
jgi:Zn-finger nucleic acid-binding protein